MISLPDTFATSREQAEPDLRRAGKGRGGREGGGSSCKVCAKSLRSALPLSLSLCLRVTYEAAPARSVFIKLPGGRGKYKKVRKVGRKRGRGAR